MDQSQIQTLLESILGTGNVYFQPPSGHLMAYPAIVYERDLENVQFADNSPYRRAVRYNVTYIDRSPNSEVYDKLASLPMSRYERFFKAGTLNHDLFNIYF